MRRENAKRLLPIALAAMLAAAVLAACGGSGSETGAAQFADKTDSPLLDFGEEAGGHEFEEAQEAADAFLAVRAKEDWKAVCAQLSQATVDKLERLASKSVEPEDRPCASFLDAFTQLSPQELSETGVDGGGLRRAGKRGFLIYEGAEEAVLALPMEEEGGEWRVAAISAKTLG